MGATILESLSNAKLIYLMTFLFTIQLVSFYIGAFLTPAPSTYEQFTSVHCYRHDRNNIAIPRHHRKHDSDVGKNCDRASDPSKTKTTTFAVQLPLPREKMDFAFSRWMQTLLVLLTPEFHYEPRLTHAAKHSSGFNNHHHLPIHDFSLLMDVDLAVKNRDDKDWTIYAQRRGIRRTLKFNPHHNLKPDETIDCDPIQLFELQSLHYDYYLINFELRDDPNSNKTLEFPAALKEVTGVAIHHNGGFTQIWMTLKSIFFVLTSATLIWFSRRLMRLNRETILIERILIWLGAALTQLNLPAELLSLFFEIPFMMFFNDLRQGIFYCVLLSFWIIFVGEHLLDGTRKESQLARYAKELLAICVASLSLLIFDLSDRGIQAFDPFLTVWETGPNIANLWISIAVCACSAYFGFLLYYIYLAFNSISGKQSALPQMQITKRLKYQGMIYRFKFLLCATAICAVSTLVFYGLSHRDEWLQSYHDDDPNHNEPLIGWTSAMLTTVYAMWNSYVMVLMIMYAPSYKGISNGFGAGMPEQIEFDCLTDDRDDELFSADSDMVSLQELANKTSLD